MLRHILFIAHRGKPRLPGGSWEVTSLDVGLVALHQASTVCGNTLPAYRGTLMTIGISHAVCSSFGSHPDGQEKVSRKRRKTSARIVLMDDNHYDPLNASDRP
jgi:hypothetical protein